MKITRDMVQKVLTAVAGTVFAVGTIRATTSQLDFIPNAWVAWAKNTGILLGILGASPLGRLIWNDPPVLDPAQEKRP